MLKDMKTYEHVKPGERGAMALHAKYGDSLVCVRYRYDAVRNVKVKTVELVVEEKPCTSGHRYRDGDTVRIGVSFTEKVLRDALKAAGAKWDPEERLWRARYGAISGNAALVERISY
jgi:hypothetical protein